MKKTMMLLVALSTVLMFFGGCAPLPPLPEGDQHFDQEKDREGHDRDQDRDTRDHERNNRNSDRDHYHDKDHDHDRDHNHEVSFEHKS
jgi:hypothetical protein